MDEKYCSLERLRLPVVLYRSWQVLCHNNEFSRYSMWLHRCIKDCICPVREQTYRTRTPALRTICKNLHLLDPLMLTPRMVAKPYVGPLSVCIPLYPRKKSVVLVSSNFCKERRLDTYEDFQIPLKTGNYFFTKET